MTKRTLAGILCLLLALLIGIGGECYLRGSVEGVASVEFFDAAALDVLREQKKSSTAFSALPVIEPFVNTVIYVELHCDTEEQALERLFAVGAAFTAVGGREENSWVARDQRDLDRLLFFRHAVPESVNMLIDLRRQTDPTITKVGSDMSVPNAHLFDVVKLYRDTLRENKLESATWGHVGNNHLHVNVLPNNAEEYALGKELFKSWAEKVSRMGGAVSAEHGLGKLKAAFLTVMYGEEHIDEMRRLKRAFDPKWQFGVGNLFTEKMPAACHVINGFGKSVGLMQLKEMGTLESPILLTNTFSVGTAATALLRRAMEENPEMGRDLPTLNPLVAECNDGYLSDIRQMRINEDHVRSALDGAAASFQEGSVGAGRGMSCLGFKGGIGSASRQLAIGGRLYTIGALSLCNFGRKGRLLLGGERLGEKLLPLQAACPAPGSEAARARMKMETMAAATAERSTLQEA